MPRGRRQVFDGALNHAPTFTDVIELAEHGGIEVNEIVKGLFKANPALIFASPQQVMVEVSLQFTSVGRLAAIGRTTVVGARAMLTEVIRHMPLYAFSQALSRMKQHDRDLENDPDTHDEIERWRAIHAPSGDATARTATLIKSTWTNFADGALSNIKKANDLKRRHPAILGTAPRLSLCTEVDKKCIHLDRAMIAALFPDVK